MFDTLEQLGLMSRLNKTFLRSLNQMNGKENKIDILIKLLTGIFLSDLAAKHAVFFYWTKKSRLMEEGLIHWDVENVKYW
ncbi:hypothetical protein WQ54_28785 [Bacillus sp. SA1-12]|nr:hypothetical protein WQ54_28785 [Bacillus sp. SA1-12]